MSAIRVLHVGDGGASSAAIAAALGADPAIDLVGRASGVGEGAAMLAAQAVDVVVVAAGGRVSPARDALEHAAAACGAAVVETGPGTGAIESFEALRRRVRLAGGWREPARSAEPASGARACGSSPAPRPAGRTGPPLLVAIGASTGGVEALVQVLSGFPSDCPPTVVVQHMPAFFTTSFAARLDGVCRPRVREAWDGAPLDRGVVYIAPGGATHLEVRWGADRRVRLLETPPVNRHRPSVDVLFRSVAQLLGANALGVLLTGMGRDGAEGLVEMRRAGARTIAQDRETSTVYGMPRAALELGAVDRGTPLDAIASMIFPSEAPQKEAV